MTFYIFKKKKVKKITKKKHLKSINFKNSILLLLLLIEYIYHSFRICFSADKTEKSSKVIFFKHLTSLMYLERRE